MSITLQDQLGFIKNHTDTSEIVYSDKQLIIESLDQGGADDVETVWYVLDMDMSDETRIKLVNMMDDIEIHGINLKSSNWEQWVFECEHMIEMFESLCYENTSILSQIPGLIPVIPTGSQCHSTKYLHANEYAAKHGVELEDILVSQ